MMCGDVYWKVWLSLLLVMVPLTIFGVLMASKLKARANSWFVSVPVLLWLVGIALLVLLPYACSFHYVWVVR